MTSLYETVRDHATVDRRIARIAARQHGVFTRAQAKQCGATNGSISWRLKTGRWDIERPSVYRLAGTARTWRQEGMAACLYLRAALTHRAAAVLGRYPGFVRARVEVTVPRRRNRSRPRRIIVHWLQDPIPDEDVTTIDGIPVSKPARTLLDLATVEPEEVVERCLDDALRRRLVSLPFLERWLEHPRRQRHRGTPMLRRLVTARATVGATDSPLETDVLRFLREEGLPLPVLQHEVWDGDRLVARVDFAYPDERVAIEADSFRHHDRRQGFDDERARGNDLEALGWRVLRVTSEHIERHRESVAEWVRRALNH